MSAYLKNKKQKTRIESGLAISSINVFEIPKEWF